MESTLSLPRLSAPGPLAAAPRPSARLELNLKRNKEQDQAEVIDAAAAAFRYDECKDSAWNPEEFALLYGTRLWDEASSTQRLALNHLYWVAYYAQIISA